MEDTEFERMTTALRNAIIQTRKDAKDCESWENYETALRLRFRIAGLMEALAIIGRIHKHFS